MKDILIGSLKMAWRIALPIVIALIIMAISYYGGPKAIVGFIVGFFVMAYLTQTQNIYVRGMMDSISSIKLLKNNDDEVETDEKKN